MTASIRNGSGVGDAAESVCNAMLVTDLDGTLLRADQTLDASNRAALQALKEQGVLRVIATGRSLFAARRVIAHDFPIDYLVYSSGAGSVRWPSGEQVSGAEMAPSDVERVIAVLTDEGLDFMIQDVVPDTHRFLYRAASAAPNLDFETRVARYREHAGQYIPGLEGLPRSSHLVAIEPPHSPDRYERIRAALAPLHVVRTTSPLDHRSRWIEVYPQGVGKSFAAERLRAWHGVPCHSVAAVGNDFNDEDMLAWAAEGFVVANAPAQMRNRYAVVASNEEAGVAEVAARVRAMLDANT